jgi:hypothetical protein
MSVRNCDRCTSKTVQGDRCRRTTCKIGKHCAQHLSKEMGLAVKKSTIANAGFGLFATRDFPVTTAQVKTKKFPRLCKYEGEIIDYDELQRRYGDELAPYTLRVNQNKYIDARSTQSGVARYINSNTGPGLKKKYTANCKFNQNQWVVLTKSVKKGEEFFLSYGRQYWAKDIKR